MLSSSSKSFFIKDILSKNHQSISSDNNNEPENILLFKPIALRYYFNNMYPSILSSSAALLSKSIHAIESSPLNLLFEMNRQRFNQSNKNTLNHNILFKLTEKIPKRKRRKRRTAFSSYQIYGLEKYFTHKKYLTLYDRDEIAKELNLSTAQVITWFQNRRAKLKRNFKEIKNTAKTVRKVQTIGTPTDFI